MMAAILQIGKVLVLVEDDTTHHLRTISTIDDLRTTRINSIDNIHAPHDRQSFRAVNDNPTLYNITSIDFYYVAVQPKDTLRDMWRSCNVSVCSFYLCS